MQTWGGKNSFKRESHGRVFCSWHLVNQEIRSHGDPNKKPSVELAFLPRGLESESCISLSCLCEPQYQIYSHAEMKRRSNGNSSNCIQLVSNEMDLHTSPPRMSRLFVRHTVDFTLHWTLQTPKWLERDCITSPKGLGFWYAGTIREHLKSHGLSYHLTAAESSDSRSNIGDSALSLPYQPAQQFSMETVYVWVTEW